MKLKTGITYSPIKQCASFRAWLSHEWYEHVRGKAVHCWRFFGIQYSPIAECVPREVEMHQLLCDLNDVFRSFLAAGNPSAKKNQYQ